MHKCGGPGHCLLVGPKLRLLESARLSANCPARPSKAVSGLKTTMQRGTPLGSERHYSWRADGWRSEASSPPQRESTGRPNFDATGTGSTAEEEKPAASAEAQNRAPKKRPRPTTAPGLAAPSTSGETVSRVGTFYEPALCHSPTSETGSGDSAEPPLQAPQPEGIETGVHDASSPIPSGAAPYSDRPGMNSYKSLDTKRPVEPSASGHRTSAWSPENARTTADMEGTE